MKDDMTCPTCGTFCRTVKDPDGDEHYQPIFTQKEIDWMIAEGERLATELEHIKEKLDREKIGEKLYRSKTGLRWEMATKDEREEYVNLADDLIKYLTE